MKKFVENYALLLLTVGVILLLDQVSKFLIRSQLGIWTSRGPWNILGVDLYLVHMPNTGIVMNLLQGAGLVITVFGLLVAGVIVYYFPKVSRHNRMARFGMGLMLGGILGNIIDRIFVGYITDFVLIGSMPVFNLADICVYSGVILMAISVLRDSKKNSSNRSGVAGQIE